MLFVGRRTHHRGDVIGGQTGSVNAQQFLFYLLIAQVTIDYGYSRKGGHDNQHLLVNYGVYVQENPNRVVSLYWSLSFSDVVSEQLLLPHLSELPFVSLERYELKPIVPLSILCAGWEY